MNFAGILFNAPIECRRLGFKYQINFFSSIETSAKCQNEIKTKYQNEFLPNFCNSLAYRTYMLWLLKQNHAYDNLVRNCLLFHSLKIHVHISFAHMKQNVVSLKLQLHVTLLKPRRR